MKDEIIVREVSIEEVVKVTQTIIEFDKVYQKSYFEDRYGDKKKLIIVAYINNEAVGYIVGYDKFGDGSFYCWMAGVSPDFRQRGVLKALMNYQNSWAKENNFNKIKITTRNTRRNMLSYLVKYDFQFTKVNQSENRISLEKEL